MQDVLGGDRLLADAAFGERQIFRDRGIEMVAHHQHVEMLVDGVAGERPGRIGGRRQHVLEARHLDDVGRVAAARAFGVVRVDHAALERLDAGLDEAGFVQRVGVDRDLHVVVVGHRQAVVDRRRRDVAVDARVLDEGVFGQDRDHLFGVRTCELAVLQRVRQRVQIDQRAPGHVDHPQARLGLHQEVTVDQPDGFGRLRQVDRDEVGLREQLVEADELGAELAQPGMQFMDTQTYNGLVSMHAALMIFVVIMGI